MSDAISTAVEQWRPVPGYEGRYEVSDQGRVRSLIGTPKLRKLTINIDGYRTVNLHGGPKRHWFFVHRLVLIAFVGSAPERHECNHKNGIKTDARLENLEWVTPQENVQHSYDVLNRYCVKGSNHGLAKLNEEQVLEIRKLYAIGVMQKDIGSKFGVKQGTIQQIVRGKKWVHVGGEIAPKRHRGWQKLQILAPPSEIGFHQIIWQRRIRGGVLGLITRPPDCDPASTRHAHFTPHRHNGQIVSLRCRNSAKVRECLDGKRQVNALHDDNIRRLASGIIATIERGGQGGGHDLPRRLNGYLTIRLNENCDVGDSAWK